MTQNAILRVRDVSRTYGATRALDGVSLDVARGSIHALLGGNGSGKSTLIKILAGVETADCGEVGIGEKTFPARSLTPTLAHACAVHVVHQHSSTFPDLTVAENLSIGRGFETVGAGHIRWTRVRDRAAHVLARFGITAWPDQKMSTLGAASQMMVAIARALQDQEGSTEGLLVLDEPTAALSAPEVALLSAALRRYAAAGQAIIIVTHRLEEVIDLADHATVLRDGKVVGNLCGSEIVHDTLVQLISGKLIQKHSRCSTDGKSVGPVVFQAKGLSAGPVCGIEFAARAGEIIGVAGLLGSGRSSLLRTIFGLSSPAAGAMQLEGKVFRPGRPSDAVRAGVAYVPEDRIADAAFAEISVCNNISVANLQRYWSRLILQFDAENADANSLAARLKLRPQRVDLPINRLSGGNQQKVVIGRWLARKPRLLLLDEPTQGVDVGARADIHDLVRQAVSEGATAVVASSDFSELADLCDRVLVLNQGRVTAEVSGPDLTSDRLHELAYRKMAA